MTNNRLILAQKLLLLFFAIVGITLCGIGFSLFAKQDTAPGQPIQTAANDSIYLALTPTLLTGPNDGQSITPALIASEPPAATVVPDSVEINTLMPAPTPYRGLITSGDRSEYKIALTFDVCQSEGDLAGFDTEIIRILNETQTHATFFLGGEWMRDHQAETLQLADNPLFELGNHSWSHRDFSAITRDEMQSEIVLAQQQMSDLLGSQTNLFRLPYGTYSEEALDVIAENGLYVIQWDVVSGDPDPNIDAQRMTNGVIQQVQPGSIVIMHANGRGWHTAEALPGIIQYLQQQGYTLVTVSDLLKLEPYK